MPPIAAFAFAPDGATLWKASGGSIEIRSWPDLDLAGGWPFASATRGLQCLALHPAGRIAAWSFGEQVYLLGADARPRGVPPVNLEGTPLALAFQEDGRLLAAGPWGVLAISPDGKASAVGVPPPARLPSWIWRAAILPSVQRVVFCVNDAAPVVYRWTDGSVLSDREWGGAALGQEGSSWLGADAAPGDRAIVCGRKSGSTTAIRLREGVPESAVAIQKPNARRENRLKRPMRTTAHAIHPFEDALVYAEISGVVAHARLSTGELVRELPRAAEGYCWE